MKELSFEKMEEVKGGRVLCFFAIPYAVWTANPIGGAIHDGLSTVGYCWNN